MVNKRLLVAFFTVVFVLTLAALPIMTGCAKPAPVKPIELKMLFGATGISGDALGSNKPWMEEVEKRSGGTVKITPLIGAVPDPAIYDAVLQGTGDLASQPIMMTTGRFPVLEAMTLPDVGTVCWRTSRAVWDFWKQTPEIEKEFSGVKLLGVWGTAPSPPGIGFGTATKPINKLDDLKGYKMGIYGKWTTAVVASTGAVTVEVPPFAVYENLQRKIIDGSCFDPEMMEAFKIYEVIKYYHNVCLMFVPFWFVVNLNTWNSLPPDTQKLLEETAALIPDWDDAYHQAAGDRAINDAITKYGVKLVDLAPEELERWRRLQDPVQDEYIAMLNGKGVDGKKVFDQFHSSLAKYAK